MTRGELGRIVAISSCVLWTACAAPMPASEDAGEQRDAASRCTADRDCDDELFCNGVETCDPGASEAGSNGCVAAGSPCTPSQTCDEGSNRCVTASCDTPDADGDGFASIDCSGEDCDDARASVHPGAVEICDATGVDEDCDPRTFGIRDLDLDGEPDNECCNGTTCGTDCDDTRAGVSPSATETCNERDDDCDGNVDEDQRLTFWPDADNDGYGDPAGAMVMACARPAMYADNDDDCNDSESGVNPGVGEICDVAMVDENCDGLTPPCPCSIGESRGCDEPGACSAGTELCVPPGMWGACSIAPAAETCNGVDDNCNGPIDEGLTVLCYADADNDGYAASGATDSDRCPDPTRTTVGGCPTGTTDHAPVGASIDCADDDSMRRPGLTETCNAIDDDCDGVVDETLRLTCYLDGDNDTYAPATAMARLECPASGRPETGGCPLGTTNRAPAPGATDCDDGSSTVRPTATEVCVEGLRVDDDCDGAVDEMVSSTCYTDLDGDTYAPAGATGMPRCRDATRSSVGFCPLQTTNRAPSGTAIDCEDDYAGASPGIAAEICDPDAHDENCDGSANPGCTCTVPSTRACPLPGVCAAGSQSCDAGSWGACSIMGGPESCDGEDDDCDSNVDEGVSLSCYADPDMDGYAAAGATPTSRCACNANETTRPPAGADVDCAPTDATVRPGASELCDRVDSDCSTGGGVALDEDADGDLHAHATAACSGGYPKDDCHDGNASVHPGQTSFSSEPWCATGALVLCPGSVYRCGTCGIGATMPSWDFNCDGAQTPRAAVTCGGFCYQCTSGGPTYSGTPTCGAIADYRACGCDTTGSFCEDRGVTAGGTRIACR